MNKYIYSFWRPIHGYTLHSVISDSLLNASNHLEDKFGQIKHLQLLKTIEIK